MSTNNGEFKGSTREAIADLKADVQELKVEVSNLRRLLIVLSIMLTVAVIERIPDFLKIISTVSAGK